MINLSEWIGREIAGGRYRILGRIGEGSMGQIYRAYDHHLETDVVLKFPVAPDEQPVAPGFLGRFEREIRSLVRLGHPHIVKVFDVGELEGHPYVVMQYLGGGSLRGRLESGPDGAAAPMAPGSLQDWLPDVARALDFIHDQRHIHRDVKPANILFDEHGNAYLGDFGIIKALVAEGEGRLRNAETAPGFLLGTPNYVAPEIVMGRPFDGRADQYALAMTVHEVLTGANCMAGPSPSATIVNQTTVVPPPLFDLVPAVSPRLSDAISRGLAKEPGDRFASCVAFAHEALADLSYAPSSASTYLATAKGSGAFRSRKQIPCPDCRYPIPIGPEHVGDRVLCPRCHAPSRAELSPDDSLTLRRVEATSATGAEAEAGAYVPLAPPEDRASRKPAAPRSWSATGFLPALGRREPAGDGSGRVGRRIATGLALLGIALIAAVLGWGLLGRRPGGADAGAVGAAATPAPAPAAPARVDINIAYGTEKEKWLKEATAAFAATDEGRHIRINLVGMGSVEGAQAVLDGPGKAPIHVWSPASSAYLDVFEREWKLRHGGRPILHAEDLALTPMVFVLWRSRYEPFVKKYGEVSFRTVAEAMKEPGGWAAIGHRPDWGPFKFAHTHPNKSNSGLLTLCLMAYEFSKKERGLTTADVIQAGFQEWLREFESRVARHGSTLSHSTGTLMRDMVLRGPSQYDCLMVYENLAIDDFDDARSRWEELQVVYPVPNMWNEHPYYILDVPWSAPEHRDAARAFLHFLVSEPVQRRALAHGFRPVNPSVPVRFPESPLVRHEAQGVSIDLPRVCEPPKAEVVTDLIATFQRLEP